MKNGCVLIVPICEHCVGALRRFEKEACCRSDGASDRVGVVGAFAVFDSNLLGGEVYGKPSFGFRWPAKVSSNPHCAGIR